MANLIMEDFAVIFDMDGVIVDTESFFDRHQLAFLKHLGVEHIDLAVVESVKHTTSQKTWGTFKKHFSLTQPLDELIQMAREDYLRFLKESPELSLNPGAKELIDQLKENNIALALASTASMRRIQTLLERFGLLDRFEALVCGDDVAESKPAPDAYLIAAEKIGYNPRDCIAVEDSTYGIQSAKNAGMCVVAYAPEHNKQNVSESDLVIKDFYEIRIDTFGKLWNQKN